MHSAVGRTFGRSCRGILSFTASNSFNRLKIKQVVCKLASVFNLNQLIGRGASLSYVGFVTSSWELIFIKACANRISVSVKSILSLAEVAFTERRRWTSAGQSFFCTTPAVGLLPADPLLIFGLINVRRLFFPLPLEIIL